ncbi:MAG: FtsQ-type POTRA domain-containing protein [Candidatus Melainabacteria bacterium]|nr:FtsQ-type POTRA domain-containing protein [Candidatus Melainabacteria bacterium]
MLPVDQRKDWIKSRRNKRKSARGARLARQAFRLFLVMSLFTVGIFGFTYLPWSLNNSESEIVVKGNHFTDTEQIRKVIADALYTPVYKMNPKELEKKVEGLETINNAFVRRYAFPRPHVVVEVLEEQPWASVGLNPDLPTHAVVAETGRIIPVKKFPHVTSPKLKLYVASNFKMTPVDVKQWATWVTFIENQTKEPVLYVDMRKPFDVSVRTEQLALKIGIPDAALTQRLSRLTSILPTLQTYKDTLEYVDLALDNNIPLKICKKLEGKAAAGKAASDAKAKLNAALMPGEAASQAISNTSTPL